MKLTKIQIIILCALFYLHFNKNPQTFTPDLSAAEFESRTIAGLNVMLSESPFEESEPTIESLLTEDNVQQESITPENTVSEIVATKNARIVLLTDPVNCGPCRTLDFNVISRIKSDEGKTLKWKVGPDENNSLQLLDRNKSPEEFNKYLTELNKFVKGGVGIPIMFKVDENGDIDQSSVRMGSMTMKEFGEYYNGLFYKNTD